MIEWFKRLFHKEPVLAKLSSPLNDKSDESKEALIKPTKVKRPYRIRHSCIIPYDFIYVGARVGDVYKKKKLTKTKRVVIGNHTFEYVKKLTKTQEYLVEMTKVAKKYDIIVAEPLEALVHSCNFQCDKKLYWYKEEGHYVFYYEKNGENILEMPDEIKTMRHLEEKP